MTTLADTIQRLAAGADPLNTAKCEAVLAAFGVTDGPALELIATGAAVGLLSIVGQAQQALDLGVLRPHEAGAVEKVASEMAACWAAVATKEAEVSA